MRNIAALVTMTGLLAVPASAASGHVVDPQGKPIAGARACLMIGDGNNTEGLCDVTDANGTFTLPQIEHSNVMRIVANGFLPVKLAAVDQEAPIVLDRAATMHIRILDAATGEPIPHSEVTLVFASGEQKGPLPGNRGGIRAKALPPGEVIPSAKAKGYRDTTGAAVTLVAGRETEVALKLPPE
jgi:hypothetical protein